MVSADVLEPGTTVLSVTENGYGKRTEDAEYKVQGRGGKGIITMKTTERNGGVVGVVQVKEDDGVMVITNHGMLIRLEAKGISVIGRNTAGVRLISLEGPDEKVVGVVRVAPDVSGGEGPEGEGAGELTGGPPQVPPHGAVNGVLPPGSEPGNEPGDENDGGDSGGE